MSVLFLTEDDVRELVDMPTAVRVVEEAFRQWAAGKAMNVPRSRAKAPGIVLHSLSASAEYLGTIGWKNYTTTRSGARFHVALYSIDTGEMITLIEADLLGRYRTGAASGVATKYLAKQNARSVGQFGTGKQAATQLEAVCCVRKIERAEVFSRDEARRTEFAEAMTARLGIDVVPVADPDTVAAGKDVVNTITSSKTHVFDAKVLASGTHLNVAGSNHHSKSEVDIMSIPATPKIVCDSIAQCRLEAGEFAVTLETGGFDDLDKVELWHELIELKDVVAGTVAARTNDEQITLFKSVGLGLEDVALGTEILRRARERNLGRPLPF